MIKKLIQTWNYLDRPHQKKFGLILIISVSGAILEMIGLGLIYPMLNFLISGEIPGIIGQFFLEYSPIDKNEIAVYLISFFAAYFVLKNITLTFFTYTLFRLFADFRIYISSRLFRGYIYSDYHFFIANNSSEITKNFTNLVNGININIVIPLGIILTDFFVLAALIGLSLAIKPIDTMILFALIIIPSLLYYRLTKNRIRLYGILSQENETLRIKTVNEMIGSIRDILLLDKSNFFVNHYAAADRQVADAAFKTTFMSQSSKYFLESVLIFAIAVLIFIKSLAGQSFLALIPILGFYALIGFRVTPSINRLLISMQMLKFGEAIIDNINQEFKRSNKNIRRLNNSLMSFNESIKIDNLAFKYQSILPYIFEGLTIEIKKGESVGICGETGSGKSSFLNILLGFLTPSKGAITIDNHDIHQNNLTLKHVMGFVPQDIFLIDDSIAKNVALGVDDNDLNRDRVYWALKEAQLESFIKRQRMGINTKVGERGVRLSGGQKQRIGIARALYFGAQILVFDEATSALDEATEKAVMQNITKLKSSLYTIVVVAHRISTLRACDRVFKLSDQGLIKIDLKKVLL